MEMEISDVGDRLRKVVLNGRLDTPAVLSIEPRFVTGLVPGGKSAIVDLSRVDFVSSMGIRMFISVARNMKDHKAKLVLYAPQAQVGEVLETVKVGQLVPVFKTAAEAAAFAQS